MKASCENCHFGSLEYGHVGSWIVCRKRAPVPDTKHEHNFGIAAVWPRTGRDEWCGDHQLKHTTDESV